MSTYTPPMYIVILQRSLSRRSLLARIELNCRVASQALLMCSLLPICIYAVCMYIHQAMNIANQPLSPVSHTELRKSNDPSPPQYKPLPLSPSAFPQYPVPHTSIQSVPESAIIPHRQCIHDPDQSAELPVSPSTTSRLLSSRPLSHFPNSTQFPVAMDLRKTADGEM